MNAIKKVRLYIQAQPDTDASRALADLTRALADEREYALGQLYEIDLQAFDLAIELLRDWRLDRFYAQRLRLFDVAIGAGMPGEVHAGNVVRPAATKNEDAHAAVELA